MNVISGDYVQVCCIIARRFMKILLWFFVASILVSCSQNNGKQNSNAGNVNDAEIIYHVVQRSFFDSNGDSHGDLNGLREKLPYLEELGVTSILLLPLYESVYYHNYFASNFEKIDQKFGTLDDFISLVKDIHARGMKIYMDMETQYVTEGHPWYKESLNNPSSPFSDYITYDDSANHKPSTIVYDLEGLKGYDGTWQRITTVNTNSEKVKEYNLKLFSFWLDPNGDGDFTDGVDGFRLDHMMDDLDNKGRWTNLFANFWTPLIKELKAINPKIIFMAEQADWGSLGFDYFSKADVDWVFAFRISFEIRNMNKEKLALMADSTFSFTPPGKNQIVFIENHDVPRFASVVDGDSGKLRIGAALNLLLGGVPSVYYGQEIGMKGAGEWNKWGMTDANEIPEREAFEWYRSDIGRGMAFWYRDTGPWWDSSLVKPNDGISVEEQKDDPNSLLSFYKSMIRLRKENAMLFKGTYHNVENNADSVFSFMRINKEKAALVVMNFSNQITPVELIPQNEFLDVAIKQLRGTEKLNPVGDRFTLQLKPYAVNVYKLTRK